MPLPEKILITLDQCDGQSSGSPPPQHVLNRVPDSDPPQYSKDATGDFAYAKCLGIKEGSEVVTYELVVWYINASSPCNGWNVFRRSPAAADPTGDFCTKSGSGVDCDDSQATSVTAC